MVVYKDSLMDDRFLFQYVMPFIIVKRGIDAENFKINCYICQNLT